MVSTMTVVGSETGPVPPITLVAVAVKAWEPSPNAGVVKVQLPLTSVVAVPIATPLLYSVMVEFGCAVPLRVGVVSSVVLPLVRFPVMVPTLSFTVVISGAFGRLVNGATTLSVPPAFPALSVAKASRVSPLVCAGEMVTLNAPLPSAVAVPSTVPVLLVMVTVLPASARPVTCVPLLITARVPGTPGATVSSTIEVMDDGALVLPAASVAVAVKLCCPLVNEIVACGSVQLPLPSAVTVPISTPPS
ncbi:hypothetical protein D3C71_1138020 [compost metagenome]